MNETSHMRSTLELGEIHAESKEINRANIEKYIEGCEELAVRLDTVIEKVASSGKRPVILIPSRGAVPIFLLARKFINELHGEGSSLADKNACYYPEGTFNYLEGKEKVKPDHQTTVDVILYPFTADVSLENSNDETLARELRNSCTRSIMQITKGIDYGLLDLGWHKFLMSKLKTNVQDPDYLNPKKIAESLESYPASEDTQIILIDTMVSGRAANDITNSFKALGHTVVPLLAVDNTKGGKVQPRRQAEIEGTLRPISDLLPEKGVFVEFPLITEDKGSGLLGVAALNFINFNEEGIFHEVNRSFNPDFRPQSCVWTLPPNSTRDNYLQNFRRFIDTAWSCRNGSPNPCTDEEILDLKNASKHLTARHEAPSHSEISELVPIERESELKESASHIVSVRLTPRAAEQWVMEFSSQR